MSVYSSSCVVDGKTISIETGRLAKQACGSVLVSCGEDRVLVSVVSSYNSSSADFFPLTVEYQEKFYSAGKIPGGFFRREGRPSYEAVLSARMIDRSIRPCFPEGYCYETQVVATALSCSGQFPLNILAGIGASSALHISDIPFNGPVAMVHIARVEDKLRANVSLESLENTDLSFIASARREGLLMVEGESRFVSEAQALSALKSAHKHIQPILDMQEELRKETGLKEKRQWTGFTPDKALSKTVSDFAKDQMQSALKIPEKIKRYQAYRKLKEDTEKKFLKEGDLPEVLDLKKKTINEVLDKIKYQQARSNILETGRRIDGRASDEIRSITTEAGWLSRVHGSSLFTRGETQVMGTVTLGTGDDEQKLDNLSGFSKKQFLLHYNFPPYSVGEVGRMGGQNRREIGHGYLAEKALKAVLPSHDDFPYTVRLVSEVLESNGSSSMGTVCAGSLALMDAGVPVKGSTAGIAMGLIQEGSKVSILSDILGDEDHLGDMDFKVAGTKEGITALQMDIKTESLSFELLEKALEQAKKGRLHILSQMNKTLEKSREDISVFAPRIHLMHIKPDKIREVIGSGGKMINKIIEETGVKIDIEDSGKVCISSTDQEKIDKAVNIIEGICAEVEEGAIYEGKVVKIAAFGAFVELLPNTTGLLHISEISHRRIGQVTDVLKEGDVVKVKVLQVGDNGKIRLSRKVLLNEKS